MHLANLVKAASKDPLVHLLICSAQDVSGFQAISACGVGRVSEVGSNGAVALDMVPELAEGAKDDGCSS